MLLTIASKRSVLWFLGNTTDDRANTKGLINRTVRKKRCAHAVNREIINITLIFIM